jgi:hypothetical protein
VTDLGDEAVGINFIVSVDEFEESFHGGDERLSNMIPVYILSSSILE